MPLAHDSKIAIVGAGVFGLSTALWLARAGYRDVTVFDMQDAAAAGYDPDTTDSASADVNKIIRFSYGTEVEYQRLAFEAAGIWDEWNAQIAGSEPGELPEVLRTGQRDVWCNSGFLRLSASDRIEEFELQTLENMEKEGIRDMQFICDDPDDIERAKQRGWAHKVDPLRREERFGVHKAVLDSSAGFCVAYKACAWAQHLAETAGVKFIFDPRRGKVVDLTTGNDGQPTLSMANGSCHEADLVIVAGGGWTPTLIPEADGLLETTAGSVATIQIPKDRSDLLEKYHPDNFPVVSWGIKEGKGIYSFPTTENGLIKVGYRATKYTNFDDIGGRRVSVPKTAHVTDHKETNIPMKSLECIKEYITTLFPDLVPLGISATKLCWYTDSIDNSFVVDFVPGRKNVVVCSGGSGHGFKFLPILGREVVKILEARDSETEFREMWRWRSSDMEKRNGLEEGEKGSRVLAKQAMAGKEDWDLLKGCA